MLILCHLQDALCPPFPHLHACSTFSPFLSFSFFFFFIFFFTSSSSPYSSSSSSCSPSLLPSVLLSLNPPPFCASLPLPPSSSLFSSFSASLPRTHLSFLVSSSSALEVLSWSRLRRLELILLLFLESLVRFSCCAGRAPPFCRFVHHVSCVRR